MNQKQNINTVTVWYLCLNEIPFQFDGNAIVCRYFTSTINKKDGEWLVLSSEGEVFRNPDSLDLTYVTPILSQILRKLL